MRFKVQLSYLGTAYSGWQRQPEDVSVQQVLEEAFTTILRSPVELVGCGRTDSGVHARYYVAHFDVPDLPDPSKTLYQVNAILPNDIAIHSLKQASPEFHARYDAVARQYRYFIHFEKNPFLREQSYYFHYHTTLRQDLMHSAAALLLQYEQFKSFCKTGSDADQYACRMMESKWEFHHDRAIYTVEANRFLRGMVRLIVGACLNIGLEKISLKDLVDSLDKQEPVPLAWSVPPEGLFLEKVIYP